LNWLEKDLTLVTVPGAGHFGQQDAADLVTSTMRGWLAMRSLGEHLRQPADRTARTPQDERAGRG
jgi:hypothetical protein